MKVRSYRRSVSFAVLFSVALCGSLFAQDEAQPVSSEPTLIASAATGASPLRDTAIAAEAAVFSSSAVLPDAPSTLVPAANPSATFFAQSQSLGTAPKHAKTIPAGWRAEPLTAKDKIIVGAKDLYSPENFLAIAVSAGYSHLTNGQPNYGTNSEAFAKRFGAAAVRETAQGVFTDMVFSPLLRQDPRYYVKGPQYGFVNRTVYAITRPLIGRTDGGHSTVNGSLLLGYAGAAALTPTFYPQSNRNFRDVASTFGGSIGGAALGFFVSEFSDQFLQAIHLKKK